jgi:hypothetical protein
MAKTIKAIRPIAIIQPNSHAGHIIPPIPPSIPPTMAINGMSAMTTTPPAIKIIVSVVLFIGLVLSGERINEVGIWEKILKEYRPMIDHTDPQYQPRH